MVSVGNPSGSRQIQNVGPGLISASSTDAVNGGQLYNFKSAIDNSSSAIDNVKSDIASVSQETDRKFAALSSSIGEARKEARQATAIGLAAASLRYDNRPGKLSLGLGAGFWRGESASVVGLGYTSQTQSVRSNISATAAGGNWGVGGGVNFTLN